MREIVSDDDVLGESPRLQGTRIGVLHVYEQYQEGDTPEVIASKYEDISVADVHAALAHVFDNPDLIRTLQDERQDVIDEIREERPVDPDDYKKRA
jgi:uncharacterized protein (DUF433 family)